MILYLIVIFLFTFWVQATRERLAIRRSFRLRAKAFLFLDQCGTPLADRQLARLLRPGTSRSEKPTGDHSRRSRRPGNLQLSVTRPLPHLGGSVEQLRIYCERYEDALCKWCLRRESTKNKPLTSKPTEVRAKALGSGVDTVLVVTSK